MNYTAYIEKDLESGLFIGFVSGLSGVHTCAASIDELHIKLKEVISMLCELFSRAYVAFRHILFI
jgi:predicted RNase H-like HicB family nuclease